MDSLDVALATLAFLLLVSKRPFARARIPHFRLWFWLGVVTSIAYLLAPINDEYLTDPVRMAYQLYRYCWKPILYYPLTALLVTDEKDVRSVLFTAVAVADLFSVQATIDGYMGIRASGPFGHGSNGLGSALLLPLMIAAARFAETKQRERWFYGLSTLLILRGLVFTGSRGAMVGALCGGALLLWGLRRTSAGRIHVRRLVRIAAVLFVVVAVARGNPFDRPSLQRFMMGSSESSSTLEWRMEERWPHFWNQVVQHPWIGVGTDEELAFGRIGNTPHNGFLSIAVTSGLPALGLFLTLACAAVRSGWRAYRRNPRGWQGGAGLPAAAGIVSVLVHNMVDTTVTIAFVAQVFWMLAAIAARMERETTPAKVVAQPRAVRARPIPLRRVRNA